MNVAVLTFIYADNYGALLQAYALKKIVENAGNSISLKVKRNFMKKITII